MPARAMPGKHATGQGAGTRSRPMSALPGRGACVLGGHGQKEAGPKVHPGLLEEAHLAHSYLDIENKAMEVPGNWSNASSVQYDLHEQQNTQTGANPRQVLHRGNRGLADVHFTVSEGRAAE